ncbi:MAG: hypothetical protein LUE08_07105 [Akkermansiaceae bacterium]|nr:hypothetical protein [Akkermansiaceae bacterium]
MTEILIRLPHPGRVLSPNAHVPMSRRGALVANAKKIYEKKDLRSRAYMLTLCELRKKDIMGAFQPKNYRINWYFKGTKPDADNCLARCKAAIDGACMAFGTDDRDLELAGVKRIHALDDKAGTLEIVFDDREEEA